MVAVERNPGDRWLPILKDEMKVGTTERVHSAGSRWKASLGKGRLAEVERAFQQGTQLPDDKRELWTYNNRRQMAELKSLDDFKNWLVKPPAKESDPMSKVHALLTQKAKTDFTHDFMLALTKQDSLSEADRPLVKGLYGCTDKEAGALFTAWKEYFENTEETVPTLESVRMQTAQVALQKRITNPQTAADYRLMLTLRATNHPGKDGAWVVRNTFDAEAKKEFVTAMVKTMQEETGKMTQLGEENLVVIRHLYDWTEEQANDWPEREQNPRLVTVLIRVKNNNVFELPQKDEE